MYDIVCEQLLKLSSAALHKLSSQANTKVTPETFYDSFNDLLQKSRIAPVVAFIDQRPLLLRLFKEDFIKRTLQMPSMASIWLDVCVYILDALCISRGKIDISHLFVVKVCALAK